MRPFFFIISLLAWVSFFPANAQNCLFEQQLIIFDASTKEPMQGASIRLQGNFDLFMSDINGLATIPMLCENQSYQITISYIGYISTTLEFQYKKGAIVEIFLSETAIGLATIIIKGERDIAPTRPTQELSGRSLQQTRGKSLGESLKNLPGMNSLQTGPGISKPVIQGLHSNRILILNNGIRLEGQQWGAEHAPEVDPFMATKITVIKGAEGVRYGPDAIGGVIILEPDELRISSPMEGEVNIAGSSNGRMGVASAILSGNSRKIEDFSWRTQVTGKRGGDFQAANYGLMNTGIREINFSLGAAIHKANRGIELFFSHFNTQVGILRSAHIGNLTDLQEAIQRDRPFFQQPFTYSIDNPKQDLSHSLLKLNAYQDLNNVGQLELKYGAQWNVRQEFDIRRGGRSDRAAIDMSLMTQSLDAILRHKPIGNLVGELGLTGMYQQNRNIPGTGVSPLIPFFNQISTGIYLIEKYVQPKYELEFGARYDYRHLEVRTFNASQILVRPELAFSNTVFTIGGQVDISKNFKFSTNLGSSWRPPHVSELFSNGLHHGVAAIERGLFYPEGVLLPESELINVQSEKSYKWVNELNFEGGPVSFNINPYLQRIDNFIYLQPRPGEFLLTIRGSFPVAEYVQTDAFLHGLDAYVNVDFSQGFTFTSSYSMVRAKDLLTSSFIIWMPADQYRLSLQKEFDGKFNPFMRFGFVHVAEQTRVDPEGDFAPPPEAYNLLSLSAGATVTTESHLWRVFLEVENLTNESYRDYMNRLRYYTDDIGRNISLRVQYQF